MLGFWDGSCRHLKTSFHSKGPPRVAGLSYRQINDWGSKGALPEGSRESGQWRKFNGGELFALMVCAEVRHRFGVPVEKLRWLLDRLVDGDYEVVRFTFKAIGDFGGAVFLLTDLESTYNFDLDVEIGTLLNMGAYGGAHAAGYILLKLNPIAKALESYLGRKTKLHEHSFIYHLLGHQHLRSTAKSPEELKLLEMLRAGDFHKIEIKLVNGSTETIVGEKILDPCTYDKVSEHLEAQDFQTIEVVRQGGKVVRVLQRLPFKFGGRSKSKNIAH